MTSMTDPLREALERLVEVADAARLQEEYTVGPFTHPESHGLRTDTAISLSLKDALEQARAALAAPAPAPALDVERLARALTPALRNFTGQYEDWPDEEALSDVRTYIAPAVATAYAAAAGEGEG